MKIAIIGGGAMGTLLGAHFCANNTVTVVDRGGRLKYLQENGFQLLQPDGTLVSGKPAVVTDNVAELEPQDFVFLAVKAYDLSEVAPSIGHLTNKQTAVVTIQNGIPWWYFDKHPGQFEGRRLESVDPGGTIARCIDARSIIGSVAYPAAELSEDGLVRHVEGYRFPVGELDGQVRERTNSLVRLFEDAGFKSRAITDIRSEYWLKAWGALSINPISALTRAKMDQICTNTLSRKLVATMMEEAQHIATSLGVTFRHTIEKRIEGAKAVGAHKTSMLCDLEAGRRLETQALIGSIVELAGITGQPAPTIEAIYSCLSLLEQNSSRHGEPFAPPQFLLSELARSAVSS